MTAFWRAAGPTKWFHKDADFDREITARFLAAHEAAAAGRLADWEATPEGALALLLLLDQFPRNMFRGSARAFASDPLARAVAERAIAHGFDTAAASAERIFFYLPFMHSENLADQERSLALVRQIGDREQREICGNSRRHHPALRALSAPERGAGPRHHRRRSRPFWTPAALRAEAGKIRPIARTEC